MAERTQDELIAILVHRNHCVERALLEAVACIRGAEDAFTSAANRETDGLKETIWRGRADQARGSVTKILNISMGK